MIFYFSATGNSQHAAERLASALEEKIISIGVAMRDGHFDFDLTGQAYLGFVVPTFAYTLPQIVADFIDRLVLTGAGSQYTFGVFTCGAATGSENAALRLALEKKGLPYNGGFDLVMQDNFIPWTDVPSPAAVARRLAQADSVLDRIIETVRARKNGKIDTSRPRDAFFPYETVDSLHGVGKLFADDKCVGCGVCAELCPTKTIRIVDGHAQFQGQCAVCFACLHRCPQKAVQYGNTTANKGRYHHPAVAVRTHNDY